MSRRYIRDSKDKDVGKRIVKTMADWEEDICVRCL